MNYLLRAILPVLLLLCQPAPAAAKVFVGQLVAKGKLSPRIDFERNGQQLNVTLKLQNITSEKLPAWEPSDANNFVASLYRVSPDGRKSLMQASYWSFVPPVKHGAKEEKKGPTAPLRPGAEVTGQIVVTLNGKAAASGWRVPNNIMRSGDYRVIFTLQQSGRVLAHRDFQVIGDTPEKLRFAALGTNSTPRPTPR